MHISIKMNHFQFKNGWGLWLAVLFYGVGTQAQSVKLAAGTLQRFENFPSAYVQPRNIDVWLPDNYNTRQKYPVLYMHDGQMLFDSTSTWNHQEWGVDETLKQLLAAGKIRECIVVAIHNQGKLRHQEYFPQKPFECLDAAEKQVLREAIHGGKDDFEPISDRYLKFIVTELKPYIDSSFSTKRNRSSTYIAGSSMGGLISLYAICEYPTVFGGAACLSTHWPGIFRNDNNPFPDAMLRYLAKYQPDSKAHKLYFDHGTATLDSLYKPAQVKVDSLLQQKWNGANWMSREFPGEAHAETAWAKRLHIPFEFLLTKYNYPPYDGNPIIWDGSPYWGNVKKVASSSYFANDSARTKKINGRSNLMLFNEQWQVTKAFVLDEKGDTTSIHVPVYNHYGKMIINHWLHVNGTLNSFTVHEYGQAGRQKVIDYSSYGTLASVEEFTCDTDTCIAKKRYFNAETNSLDDVAREKTITIMHNGNPVSTKNFRGDMIVWQARTEYTKFDKYGNWIECRTSGSVFGEIVELVSVREISYFQ
jgi:predicted alpha/beta superfamily hydrolase